VDKPEAKRIVSVNLNRKLAERLKKEAKESRRSFSAHIEMILHKWVHGSTKA
jgi:hypothetical protein